MYYVNVYVLRDKKDQSRRAIERRGTDGKRSAGHFMTFSYALSAEREKRSLPLLSFTLFQIHIKSEIFDDLWGEEERKRKKWRKGGGAVARGFKHDANHLEEREEAASTACSV